MSIGDVVGKAMGGKDVAPQGKKKEDDNLPKKAGGRFGNSRMNGPLKSSATPNFGKK